MASKRNPTTWDEYDGAGRESGSGGSSPGRAGSISSQGNQSNRSIRFQLDSPALGRSPGVDDGLDETGGDEGGDWRPQLRRRRSSANRIVDLGGLNSIRSFARSWQRAANFAEVIPRRSTFAWAPDHEPAAADHDGDSGDVEAGRQVTGPSLLGQSLRAAAAAAAAATGSLFEHAIEDDELLTPASALLRRGSGSGRKALLGSDLGSSGGSGGGDGIIGSVKAFGGTPPPQPPPVGSIFAVPPQLALPSLLDGYGSMRSGSGGLVDYGTMDPILSRRSSMLAGWQRFVDEEEGPGAEAGGEEEEGAVVISIPAAEAGQEPIFIKEVEQDGRLVLAVEGQSTSQQTIFNSINVLVGVGLLSLPMGMKHAGWVLGLGALTLYAMATAWSARLLARCMDLDPSLITFSDVAWLAFGKPARVFTSILFTLELLAPCVALIVLFSDTLGLLFPAFLAPLQWKFLCAGILVPMNFTPLRLLSFTSVLGIMCCLSIVSIMLIDGFVKPTAPGSLVEPAKTYLFPTNWRTLPLSFGLLMAPWGGHSVFPNIYRDMRHPHKYPRALRLVFSFTYLLDTVAAVAGLLMFGDHVKDEITANLLETSGYPRALSILMCLCVAIIPLTKIPLNARPIVSTVEILLGLHQQPGGGGLLGNAPTAIRSGARVMVNLATIGVFLFIAVVFPAFDRIVAFMGSALCFSVCLTLPFAFYLKLFGQGLSRMEKALCWFIMLTSLVLSIVGTIWAFLPKTFIEGTG